MHQNSLICIILEVILYYTFTAFSTSIQYFLYFLQLFVQVKCLIWVQLSYFIVIFQCQCIIFSLKIHFSAFQIRFCVCFLQLNRITKEFNCLLSITQFLITYPDVKINGAIIEIVYWINHKTLLESIRGLVIPLIGKLLLRYRFELFLLLNIFVKSEYFLLFISQ